jgi:ubiquinone/menaquinone biosynthesis C-methylase UbiE
MVSEFLKPIEILNKLKLRKNLLAADFGSGSGGWAIPLAKILEDGTVYAIDILEEPLSALRGRMNLEKIRNIRIIRSNIENKQGSTLPNDSVDLVLMTNLLFQCENKKNVLEEGKRVLKKGGRLLVVDWARDNPLTEEIEYVSFDQIKEIARELDLKLEKEFEAGIYHQGLIFKK